MNNCFWCFINDVCDCNNCADCKDYINVNTDDGMKLFKKYRADVDEALIPVFEKWKKIKEQKQ